MKKHTREKFNYIIILFIVITFIVSLIPMFIR